jgi:hypothetical protein
MTDAAGLTSTRHLLADLVTQVSDLLSIEARLVRAELSETASKATSGLALLASGFIVLLAGLIILSFAGAALLVRLGLAPDIACLIVAAVASIAGGALVLGGLQRLKPANLAPSRSLDQLAKGLTLGRSD